MKAIALSEGEVACVKSCIACSRALLSFLGFLSSFFPWDLICLSANLRILIIYTSARELLVQYRINWAVPTKFVGTVLSRSYMVKVPTPVEAV